MSSSANQGWQDYWKSDRPASCVPENARTADEIAAYWVSKFAELPDGARILDVATGNGILLAHAASAASQHGKSFALTGVDLADIDPQKFLSEPPEGFRDARFLGGTPAERLPFGDGEFDTVVSQYGLEYARLDRALAEVERVLVPGGGLVWLAHCEDSDVVRQNRDQGRQVEFLLAPRGPLAAMEKFVARIARGRNPSFAERQLQAALTDAEAYCREHPPAKIVGEVCTVIAATANRWRAYRARDLARMLSDSRQRLLRHRQRINDLVAAVITPDRLEQLGARLNGPGWNRAAVEPFAAGAGQSPIGLLITAERSAS